MGTKPVKKLKKGAIPTLNLPQNRSPKDVPPQASSFSSAIKKLEKARTISDIISSNEETSHGPTDSQNKYSFVENDTFMLESDENEVDIDDVDESSDDGLGLLTPSQVTLTLTPRVRKSLKLISKSSTSQHWRLYRFRN